MLCHSSFKLAQDGTDLAGLAWRLDADLDAAVTSYMSW